MSLSKLDKIMEFMKTQVDGPYDDGDIWQKIASLDDYPDKLPCMDIVMEFYGEHEECDELDFTEEQKIIMLFFSGDSSYFPGIWIGNDELELLDCMPIYIIDIDDSQSDESEIVGNFRSYIEQLLNGFLNIYNIDDEYCKTAHLLLEKVKEFSSNMIDKGVYKLKAKDNTNY
jgi:hypothetical protein